MAGVCISPLFLALSLGLSDRRVTDKQWLDNAKGGRLGAIGQLGQQRPAILVGHGQRRTTQFHHLCRQAVKSSGSLQTLHTIAMQTKPSKPMQLSHSRRESRRGASVRQVPSVDSIPARSRPTPPAQPYDRAKRYLISRRPRSSPLCSPSLQVFSPTSCRRCLWPLAAPTPSHGAAHVPACLGASRDNSPAEHIRCRLQSRLHNLPEPTNFAQFQRQSNSPR